MDVKDNDNMWLVALCNKLTNTFKSSNFFCLFQCFFDLCQQQLLYLVPHANRVGVHKLGYAYYNTLTRLYFIINRL